MESNMQQTSLDAFHSISSEQLGTKQLQVLLSLKKIQPATNAMIGDYLNWPINTITARVHELRNASPRPFIITSHRGKCEKTGKTALFWKVNNG